MEKDDKEDCVEEEDVVEEVDVEDFASCHECDGQTIRPADRQHNMEIVKQ